MGRRRVAVSVGRRWVAAAGAAIVLAPSVAGACPFCSRAGSSSDAGYLLATGILIALPVALLGGFVHWLRRHERGTPAPPSDETPAQF